MSHDDWNYGPDKRKQDESDLGEIIQDLVEGAIDSVDFNGLSDKIKSTIEDAVPKVAQLGQDWQRQLEENRIKVYEQRMEAQRRARENSMRQIDDRVVSRANVMKPREILPVYRNLPGRYSGPLSIFAGTVGLIGAAAGLIASGIGGLAVGWSLGLAAKIGLGLDLAAGIGFGSLLGHGIRAQKKVKRYLSYQQLWKDKKHISIEDLHKGTGLPEEKITKDLHNIVDKRLLPVSYIDDQETCLILDEQVYKQYQDAEKSRKEREAEEEKKRQEARAFEMAPAAVKMHRQILADESSFLSQIAEKKAAISSFEMKEKITTLESMVERLYTCVKEYPAKYEQIYRVRDYYLPTMIKLLGTYAQVENQPVQKDNILKTKKEIEDSLDMINQAMEVMFDDLFSDVAMDTSADVTVLGTMLSRDGWKGNELKPDENAAGPLIF